MSTTPQAVFDFVKKQHRILIEKNYRDTRCIDERYAEKHKPAPYPIPAGGSGARLDLKNAFEKKIGRPVIKDDVVTIFRIADKHLDLTLHTASYHPKGTSCVAGCGYAVDMVEGNVELSPDTAALFKQELEEAVGHLKKGGKIIPSFDVPHTAKGVFIMMTDDFTIIPTDEETGDCYFTYCPKVRNMHFRNIVKDMFAEDMFNGVEITEEEFYSFVVELADARLGNVIVALGADKIPHYEVYSLTDIIQVHTPVLEETVEID